ncbi:hypothetical protein [Blastococcus sp. CT_GayMR16]|uniref:hypothetical protein n=1 Tax=Blastococcus sp. CT_GayMR16 TaxID=2559607 RepID=UPI00107434AF|nr:hypothetical protein [Blastococcus sp. CT_GayMR16]TFV90385.1 hypothetical protein E4P38_02795 [Blastococcus sp. CT_GayMR16]
MAFKGRKVADVYAELHLDRDSAQATLRGSAAAFGPDADRAGRELGKRMTDGLAKAVEASSARLVKARRAEVDASNAVTLAERRLLEARQKGMTEGSARALALTQALEKAQYRLSQAQSNTVTSTRKLDDAQRSLASSMGALGKDLGPQAQKAGDDAGGKLALGMRMSLIRNSPLIVAAIGGVLAAGAPLMSTAAVALFAGIGIVAAAQSAKVQSAWLGTWQQIKAGAIADAGAIEPVLVGLAGKVSAGFDRMRPSLRNVFSDAAPQIEVFAGGILDLAENALPGLARAVERGMPVTKGFADFLSKTGTGLSDFFDKITDHGPAAGQVWSQLGTSMQKLLPTLGELLGQGAELASDVLPLLNGALGGVLGVVDLLGPALPTVATAFGAFKVGDMVAGWMGSAATGIGKVGDAMGGSEEGAGVFSGMLSTIGDNAESISEKAGPILGAAITAVTVIMERASEQAAEWADALRQGGAAADETRATMGDYRAAFDEANSGFGGFIAGLAGMNTQNYLALSSIEQTNDALHEQWVAMNPLQQAQAKVAEWSKTLTDRMLDESTSASDLEAAKRRLAFWQAEGARLAAQEESAIKGVTQAMADQVDQARSRVDAGFAYEQSLNGIEDAQAKLNEVLADGESTTEDVERAQLALNQAYDESVQAAGRIATSNLPASMDDTQKAILGAKGELDRLNQLIAQGVQLPQSMEDYRQQLIQITGQADGAMLAQAQLAAAVGELGFAVAAVPGEKSITITAPTDELRQRLADLGFTIKELPNGDIEVVAETDQARGHLTDLSTQLTGLATTTATPTVDANTDPALAKMADAMSVLFVLSGQKPMPVLDLDINPFAGATATATAQIEELDGQRPTPVADVDTAQLNAHYGGAMNVLAVLAGQRPTPWANLNPSPLLGGADNATQRLNILGAQRPTPSAFLNDYASGGLDKIAAKLAALHDKTVTVTTKELKGKAGGGPIFAATGRMVIGPGGPTDDLVRAVGPGGTDYRLSAGEFINNAMTVGEQGGAKFAALNSGRADIVMRGNVAGGGRFAPGSGASTDVDYVTSQLFEAMTAGINEGVDVASPQLTSSILRATPTMTAAVRSASPSLTGAIQAAAPTMTRSVSAAAPFMTQAVVAAGPALTNAVSVAAGSLSDAVRNALLAAGWRGDPTDGQERLYAPAGGGGGGSQSFIFDEARQNDPVYMNWWNGLLGAGWKGNPNDSQERLYSPYARGGRFGAGQFLKVGEEGEEFVQFDQPGRVFSADKTRELAAAGGKSVVVQNLTVELQGFDIRDRAEIRRFARALREELLNVDREDS